MNSNDPIQELEIRITFLENTVEELNQQLASVTQEFSLAKQAMRLMHQRLEQMHSNDPENDNFSDDTPPPHY